MLKITQNRGFTLIEVLLALIIVVVLITAFTGAMIAGFRSETSVNNSDCIVNFSASIMDYLSDPAVFRLLVKKHLANKLAAGSYQQNIAEFIDNDLKEMGSSDLVGETLDIKSDLTDLYHKYELINNFQLTEQSEIKISDQSEIITGLYKVELDMHWLNRNQSGQYNLATFLGVD